MVGFSDDNVWSQIRDTTEKQIRCIFVDNLQMVYKTYAVGFIIIAMFYGEP